MWAVIICVIAAVLLPQPQPQPPRTLDGRAVDPLRAEQGVRATALIFIRTDCPSRTRRRRKSSVSGRCTPTAACGSGSSMWTRGSRPIASRPMGVSMAFWRRPFAIPIMRWCAGPVSTSRRKRRCTCSTGPHRASPIEAGIDDRVVELGRQRPRATRFDLRDALESALDHKAPALVATPAAGCEIADLR